ncbi:MAG TPA: heme NO-binding domain-containing protein [Candidatus Nitrosotenuis sp.]|jgi:hypothetical protein|nr:heme NO-binding domain-containing protein [Candidatus Nitrosotenuis sp.]
MKGILFTELLEMAEERWGLALVDRALVASELPHGGAYTSVGTYGHGEFLRVVDELGRAVGLSRSEFLSDYGRHLFARLLGAYPQVQGPATVFEFLQDLDGYVHLEVLKLYPDARPPRLSWQLEGPDRLVLLYESHRPLADLARGLLAGCIAHFGEDIALQTEDLSGGQGTRARFVLERRSP